MKRRLFLTGSAGCGKSLLIQSILGEALQLAGGFLTKDYAESSGLPAGRYILPAAAAAGVEGFEPVCFLDRSKGQPNQDNEVFRGLGTQLLQESLFYPFVLLDDIGGTDLLIPQYRAALEELLNSPLPCIGVIKSEEEILRLKKELGLTERFVMLNANMRKALENDNDTFILQTSGKGDIKALRIIQQWAAEYT